MSKKRKQPLSKKQLKASRYYQQVLKRNQETRMQTRNQNMLGATSMKNMLGSAVMAMFSRAQRKVG